MKTTPDQRDSQEQVSQGRSSTEAVADRPPGNQKELADYSTGGFQRQPLRKGHEVRSIQASVVDVDASGGPTSVSGTTLAVSGMLALTRTMLLLHIPHPLLSGRPTSRRFQPPCHLYVAIADGQHEHQLDRTTSGLTISTCPANGAWTIHMTTLWADFGPDIKGSSVKAQPSQLHHFNPAGRSGIHCLYQLHTSSAFRIQTLAPRSNAIRLVATSSIRLCSHPDSFFDRTLFRSSSALLHRSPPHQPSTSSTFPSLHSAWFHLSSFSTLDTPIMPFGPLPQSQDISPLPRLHLRISPSPSSPSTTPRPLPSLRTVPTPTFAAPGPATPPSSPIEACGSNHLSFPLIASLLYTFPTGATLHPRTPSRNPSASSVATTISAGLGKH